LQVEFVRVFEFKSVEEADHAKTFMTTISSIGMAIGALSSGPLTRFGKKNCIHMTNGLVILACGIQLIKVYGVVLAGRFLFGLAGGAFSVFVPSFINEVTPTELKGPFGSAT
jgi:MFS family permease